MSREFAASVNRFTRRFPCPICNGGNNDPRGKEIRCYGFLSSNGAYAHCTRVPCGQQEDCGTWPHRLDGDCNCGTRHGHAPIPPPRHVATVSLGPIVATYDYIDADRCLSFQVCRYAEPEKTFRQRRPDGNGGWIWKVTGVQSVPYHMSELLAADPEKPIFIVEGEKDVHRLESLGFLATTNPGGAGKWPANFAVYVKGHTVIVVPDNDPPGRAHADDVARKVHGSAASVQILDLPGLPPKGDVSDWFDTPGNTVDQFDRLAAEARAHNGKGL